MRAAKLKEATIAAKPIESPGPQVSTALYKNNSQNQSQGYSQNYLDRNRSRSPRNNYLQGNYSRNNQYRNDIDHQNISKIDRVEIEHRNDITIAIKPQNAINAICRVGTEIVKMKIDQ